MYLKSLALKGFKSFAEPASIRFEPGVTVVVGPNGSGKSNVVDAVAWVLGAQAPSAVRSSRMDDVIFAGTAHKPALGRAEVSLTIDNSDGALPMAASEVRITRTLYRDGESSYALNGTPCRLLDITEMLSDTGMGRQQHMIVSQNQIDAVLNARPTERRAVVEEAAGILKYRKRRERAERRLLATDADLKRLSDLTGEVRRRLRPLQKQAEAARRHADLLSELEALRVCLAGREVADLRERLRGHKARGEAQATERAELRAELDEIGALVADSEQRLAVHGLDDHSERLARLEGLRARAAGLAAVAAERKRGLARERAALGDQGLAVSLRDELSRCRAELESLAPAEAAAAQGRSALEQAQALLAQDRAAHEAEWAGFVPFGAAEATEAAEARGELAAIESAVAMNTAERQRQLDRLEESRTRLSDGASRLDQQRRELAGCDASTATLREQSAAASAVHAAAADALEDALAARGSAEGNVRHWTARQEALAMAVDSSAQGVPAEVMAACDGIVGLLGDLVDVEPGAEAAFAAAVGEAASAVVARDAAAARSVLHRLEASDAAAAVIALEGVEPGQHGAPVAGSRGQESLRGQEMLRTRVRASDPDVSRLLDLMLESVVLAQGDWRAAADVWTRHRDAVVVTAAGDRLSSRGWRLGVHGAAGIAAALAESQERATEARAAFERATEACVRARAALSDIQGQVAELGLSLAEAESRAASIAQSIARLEADRSDASAAEGALRDHLAEVSSHLDECVRNRARISSRLPELEAAEKAAAERARQAAEARAALDERALELASTAADQRAQDAGRTQRRRMLEERAAELQQRLAAHDASRAAAGGRIAALEREAAVLDTLRQSVEDRSAALDAQVAEIRALRRRHSELARALAAELDDLRQRSAGADRRHEALRTAETRHEIEEAETRTLLQTAVERLRDTYGVSASEAVEMPLPPLRKGTDPQQRLDELSAELEVMGPVNPLALAEYDELSERHELLSGQLDDIRSARRDLNRVIRSIDAEIRTVFAAAFADVAANFEVLFEALFPGGEGRLALSDPDDLLDCGIDISAKPSGKNVKRLSLLSGGERSLAALAFLFAVFRSRPSPFYVMDEVEAALDDVNLHRFLALVDEFRSEAQLVIVTHQKRTMEAADCLQGVSMKPGGSSMVVSERVSEAA